MMLPYYFIQTHKGKTTEISLTETLIEIFYQANSRTHRIFEGLVGSDKNSVGSYHGFKPRLIYR